jgi:hypothetical protein
MVFRKPIGYEVGSRFHERELQLERPSAARVAVREVISIPGLICPIFIQSGGGCASQIQRITVVVRAI